MSHDFTTFRERDRGLQKPTLDPEKMIPPKKWTLFGCDTCDGGIEKKKTGHVASMTGPQ